jgi:hypothetical protein
LAKANTQSASPAGKWILGTVAGMTTIGGFLADWNKTHLFNPNWPPHAKFHDAWTITLGSFLGSAGLYFLLRKGKNQNQDLNLAALLPAMYWSAQAISFTYPGAKGLEAEFPERVPRIGGVWISEHFAAGTMLSLLSLGYMLEKKRHNIL